MSDTSLREDIAINSVSKCILLQNKILYERFMVIPEVEFDDRDPGE